MQCRLGCSCRQRIYRSYRNRASMRALQGGDTMQQTASCMSSCSTPVGSARLPSKCEEHDARIRHSTFTIFPIRTGMPALVKRSRRGKMPEGFQTIPDWFSFENQGAGVAITDFGDGQQHLVVLMVDNPPQQNRGIYRIGHKLNGEGRVIGDWT